jgi:hypothetical protein
MRHTPLLFAALAALAACESVRTPTDAPAPFASISDGAHGGTPGFNWLPPMVSNPGATGTFDGSLSPVVEICGITGSGCAPVATYTTTSGPSGEHVVVKSSESHYMVNWHTRDFDLDLAVTYRIRVRVGTRELGHADMKLIENGSAAKNVNTAEYIPLIDGRTLPIKFRIDTGIPGALTVTPATATVQPGGTQQYTATVTDLHGNVIISPISWSSGAPSIATVSASGLATGVASGTATITATSGGLSGTAQLVVDQPLHRWTVMNAPTDQGNWDVWGTSATNIYAANWLGVMHFDGTTWSKIDTVYWHGTLDIHGTSASNIYTAGANGRIMHFDGQVWSQERYDGSTVFPQQLGDWTNILPNIYLWGIWPASPSDWFIVGEGGHILRGQQGSWQTMSSGTTETLRRVWGSSATDVYATGENGVLLHYDGTAWSQVSLPVSTSMWGVWGSSASDVWVAGDAGKLLHYDGSSWSVTQLPTPNRLYGVWGTSTNNVYVGTSGGEIYRWDGTRWIYEDSSTNAQIFGFWGPSATDVHAATGQWELIRR